MYRIEMIFRQSCIDDISKFWEATGRTVTADKDGQAVFENVVEYNVIDGVIEIANEKGEVFFYNVADFYRIKVIKQ